MTWTPSPFKHTATVSVTTWLSNETSVEGEITDVPVEDVSDVTEYLAAQLTELAKKLKPKRRSRPRKKPSPITDDSPSVGPS